MLLALVLGLGILLRLYGLGSYPFEEDELYTVIEATHLFESPLRPGIEARPLYYLLQHVLFEWVPPTHVGMRLLPLLFGLLGIYVTWKLGAELFGRLGAAAAALWVALAPWHLHVSGMARYGSLLYLLSTLFLLFLIRAWETDRPRDYAAALVALVLGTATHPTFLFPVVGVALGTALVRRSGQIGWTWPSRAAWSALWLPFAAFAGAGYLILSLLGRGSSLRNFSGRGLEATLRLVPAIVEWLTPVMVAAAAAGALALLPLASTTRQRRWAVAAIGGVASTLAALVAASTVTNVYADYAVVMLPMVFVSAGGLIHLVAERAVDRKGVLAATVMAVIGAGLAPSLVSHLSDGMRFDPRPAFRAIAATAPELPVLTTPIIFQRHYAPELDGRELKMTTAQLEDVLASHSRFWVVALVRREGLAFDASGEVAPWLARHCRLTHSHQRPRFDYRVYRVDLHLCGAPLGDR
ncbi:MAG TPA: glycosyltransferase family 39 protein [Longimicrobiales bacterium]